MPEVGALAPDFTLPDQAGKMRALNEFRGTWLVLYFYPKDDTPKCTQEACFFRDDYRAIRAMGAEVVGVSTDDARSHTEFSRKYSLPFTLLTDQDGEVSDRYGSLWDIAGIKKISLRHTFIINSQGKIAKTYKDVDTLRHSKEVISDLENLMQGKTASSAKKPAGK
jgi:peroxiredoxin Q/BCP